MVPFITGRCSGDRGKAETREEKCESPRWVVALLALGVGVWAQGFPAQRITPLAAGDLDAAAYRQWVDGAEAPIAGAVTDAAWTTTGMPIWCGTTYGDGKNLAVRYLRFGFARPLAIGAILVRGGGVLSVLKPDAAYPGNLHDDTQWLPAQRLRGRGVTDAEVGEEEYAIWTLPPGTSTRALRFAHTPDPADKSYACHLGGFYLFGARFANVAPQGMAFAVARTEAAGKLIDSSNNGTWDAWDNGPEGAKTVVSPEHPEVITLLWPKPVTLSGLCALWAGCGAVEVQSYAGPDDVNPREAFDNTWLPVAQYTGLDSMYPLGLGVNLLAFPAPVTTRAVRLRLTATAREGHPHLQGKTKDGKRVWLGEVMALQPLTDKALDTAILPTFAPDVHPPIPVRFTLKEPGVVTLVIDDAQGKRVRNLVSETFFPAGENTAWWDGLDDLGRDTEAARHGIYHVPGTYVTPGTFTVRGLVSKGATLKYEFSLYNAGTPAWSTADNTGGWLTNHTPPSSACFVPASRAPGGQPLVYLGSYVAEGGHGLAWVDLDGHKVGGKGWVGGNWTGAPYLACDTGPHADPNTIIYAGSAWEKDQPDPKAPKLGELRITAITAKGEHSVVQYTFPDKASTALAGLAVYDNLLACTLPKLNKLLLVDVTKGAVQSEAAIDDPRGVAFDNQHRLLLLAGKHLLRITLDAKPVTETVIAAGLDDPQHVTCDADGTLYITDRGASHQVKVFSADGKPLRAIGHAGVPKAGPYDPLQMHNPNGLTLDARHRLWVAETDFQPKRVSVWSLDGKLLQTFYGPSEYGGGGALDPTDPTRFYYHGMLFTLDWKTGTDKLTSVIFRPAPGELGLPTADYANGYPQTPLYVNGKRYFTNCYNNNPVGGSNLVMLWREREGIARPVAAFGCANSWDVLKTDAYKARWPQGINLNGDYWQNQTFFTWSDLNGDGLMQPDEVTMRRASAGGIVVASDLSFTIARIDGVTARFRPVRLTDRDVPVYDIDAGQVLIQDVKGPASSGGDQTLSTPDGWQVLTLGAKPYSDHSVCGFFKGTPRWSYPNMWPGLHASHESAAPEFPGELIGVTRLLGPTLDPKGSTAGPLWCVNSNQGCMYLFTMDGLFVSTLFRDVRVGHSWSMPIAPRGMDLTEVTCHDENFWPSITQTPDGKVYLIDGGRTSLVRVDGLDTLRRLPDAPLTVTKDDLAKAALYGLQVEAARQRAMGVETLTVALRPTPPTVDGKLDDWATAQWVSIDKRGVAAYFNSNTRPYDVRGAAAVTPDHLYVAFSTGDPNLLRNSGEVANAPFKTGGALDIMLGADPRANLRRNDPVAGDMRLLVTQVKGKTLALLYRAVVPGTANPVPFSSPWRTVTIDKVDDVSDQVQLAGADGDYELSIPLATLGLTPFDGMLVKGDLGILRGDGFETLQRVYWSNKATGITADVPSEAMLTPMLWGKWQFGR